MKKHIFIFIFLLISVGCSAADLTGNWVVETPTEGGPVLKSYFNLKQEPSGIIGTIRVTQFFYTISESEGGPDSFKITGSMRDGNGERHVVYEGRLVGDELRLATRRRPDAP